MIIYTAGTFDLFHFGHVFLLKKCRQLVGPNGKVVIALNTDEFIKQYKGKYPVLTYEERRKSLLDCQYVDKVIPNIGGADSKPSILEAKPDIVAIGSDWARKDYYKQMDFTQDWLDEQKIILCYIPRCLDISSSQIKERIKND
jgi:glycerol-3-phosphate cytidylyltransferase